MTRKQVQHALEKALLYNGHMYHALYIHELEELHDKFMVSLIKDNDALLFAVTENRRHVAMVLLEPSGAMYSNEDARAKLQEDWRTSYEHSIRQLIPAFTDQFLQNELPINGVKFVEAAR